MDLLLGGLFLLLEITFFVRAALLFFVFFILIMNRRFVAQSGRLEVVFNLQTFLGCLEVCRGLLWVRMGVWTARGGAVWSVWFWVGSAWVGFGWVEARDFFVFFFSFSAGGFVSGFFRGLRVGCVFGGICVCLLLFRWNGVGGDARVRARQFCSLGVVGLAYWFVSRVGARGAVAAVCVVFFAVASGWGVKAWFWEFVRSRSAWLDLTGFHNCW